MLKPFAAGDALPTIYRAYKPVEEYLEALGRAGDEDAPVALAPVDALLVHLLVTLCPDRPALVDLAGDATHGASTVLCGTQSRASRVVSRRRAPRGKAWQPFLTRFLDHYEAGSLAPPLAVEFGDATLDLGPRDDLFPAVAPVLVFFAAEGNPGDLVQRVRGWAERGPDVVAGVLGLGDTGACEYVGRLVAAFDGRAAHRLVLPRERAAALHASTLGLVYPRSSPYLEHALARLARLFTGNFSFLGLVKKACEDAIRAADVDNAILESHPLGPVAGTRRRIAELEQALAAAGEGCKTLQQVVVARDQELAELRRRGAELECALAAARRQTQDLTGSLTFKAASRFRKVRTVAAPDGSLRHRVLQKTVRVLRVWKCGGLREILWRTVRKVGWGSWRKG
jgi:hypothetical protein